jgi:hypothetical protein
VAQAHEQPPRGECRCVEPCHHANRLEGQFAGLVELAAQSGQLARPRRSVQPADAEADRMDRAPAGDREDLVADLLQAQSAFDDRPVELRELDGARQAEEVRGVEQVNVERVALDPLPAIQQPAQRAHLRIDVDAEQVLEGVDRGQLVGDRADAADAGDDVDDFVGRPPDHDPFEEARRLEDPQPCLDDLAVAHAQVEATLTLDSGELVDVVRPFVSCVHRRPRWPPPLGALLPRWGLPRGTARPRW